MRYLTVVAQGYFALAVSDLKFNWHKSDAAVVSHGSVHVQPT